MGSGRVPGLCLLVLLVHARAAQHGKAAQGKGGAAQRVAVGLRGCGTAGSQPGQVSGSAWLSGLGRVPGLLN